MPSHKVLALLVSLTALAIPTPAALGARGESCEPTLDRSRSVARHWDEVLLDAIRRDLPAPTIHSRNLFHTSAAMWDAWAAYDPTADGVYLDRKVDVTEMSPEQVERARETAMSYAAYRILSERYEASPGAEESLDEFDALMGSMCLPTGRTRTRGDTPAALGNRIGAAILAAGKEDGSNERGGYKPPDYAPVNEPMIVKRGGTDLVDPDRWQPLALDEQVAQNGLPLPDKVQAALGPHWGHVTPFAIAAGGRSGMPVDPGPPPSLHGPDGGAAYKEAAVEVIRRSSLLDPSDGETIDISPAAIGNDSLGADDGTGHRLNPVTGEPYEPTLVPRGDYTRALAAFWADGPRSETPPGHWNTIANATVDSPGFSRRIGGTGEELDPLEWDVKMYLALNGAVYDAAIEAWGVKGHYDSVRPISMIRYMGGLGQSSDPAGPSYDADGLPLVPGLIEVITEDSSAPGERHADLADHLGEIAIRAWAGNPADPETEASGVGWILAVDWVPFQLPTFVTPAFPGFVSGHSTFSRAAAEVLTAMTGSEYVPGGLGSWTVPANSLEVERGPSVDVPLQWATYYDAADQAGQSRIYGGIHITADDYNGRVLGSLCGKAAWEKAEQYFDGTARA
jgi:hypothetical protein